MQMHFSMYVRHFVVHRSRPSVKFIFSIREIYAVKTYSLTSASKHLGKWKMTTKHCKTPAACMIRASSQQTMANINRLSQHWFDASCWLDYQCIERRSMTHARTCHLDEIVYIFF